MLWGKDKIEKMLKVKKERAEEFEKSRGYVSEEDEKLTKEDIQAVIISAAIVFGPIFLVLFGLIYLFFIAW